MEDGKSESVRGSRAQAGRNGALVFFKVEPSQALNPQRCLPGLIRPGPLVPSHLRASLHTSISICLSLSLVPLLSFAELSPCQRPASPLFCTALHARCGGRGGKRRLHLLISQPSAADLSSGGCSYDWRRGVNLHVPHRPFVLLFFLFLPPNGSCCLMASVSYFYFYGSPSVSMSVCSNFLSL